jgi:hypothetical protein
MLRDSHRRWWQRILEGSAVPAYLVVHPLRRAAAPSARSGYEIRDRHCPACHSLTPEWRPRLETSSPPLWAARQRRRKGERDSGQWHRHTGSGHAAGSERHPHTILLDHTGKAIWGAVERDGYGWPQRAQTFLASLATWLFGNKSVLHRGGRATGAPVSRLPADQ